MGRSCHPHEYFTNHPLGDRTSCCGRLLGRETPHILPPVTPNPVQGGAVADFIHPPFRSGEQPMVQALNPTRRVNSAIEVDRWAEAGPFRQTRVIVVEPRSLVRDAFRSLIEGSDTYSVVGEAADLDAALGMVSHLSPSVVVMNADVAMSGLGAA